MKTDKNHRSHHAAAGLAGGRITTSQRCGFGRAVVLLALLWLGLGGPAHAAPGDLDPLDANVVGNNVTASAVQPDGKTIIAGTFTSVLGQPRNNIARLNADGTLDAGFNPNVTAAPTTPSPQLVSSVWSVAVQADGKILLGGGFIAVGGFPRNYIARLNTDGTLDAGFNPNANGQVYSVAVQADGRILLGGFFTSVGGTTRNCIARVDAAGALDTGFNPDVPDLLPYTSVFSVAVQADGRILLGGWFNSVGGFSRNNIARVDAAGALDAGFKPNVNNTVYSVAVQADGRILLGGSFTRVGGTERNRIARVDAAGALDAGFNPNADGIVNCVAVQADGRILVGGNFTSVGGTPRNRIARVDAAGALDAGFDPNANSFVYSVAVQADGRILLGGDFASVGGTARNKFARLLNDPATQTLSAPDATQVTWTRGGSSPEVSLVTFEQSTDSGATWTPLGSGTRIGTTPDWQLSGLSLPASGQLRARGRTTGGYRNGSSGLVEGTASFAFTAPEIAVEQPAGTDLADGGTRSFGSVVPGSSSSLTFTITNSGVDPLNLTGTPKVAVAGANAGDFTVSLQPTSPVAALNGSTTFTVQFSPQAGGTRTASLSIANDDADENPFDIVLTGIGIGPEIAVEQPAGTDLTSGTSTTAFGTVTSGASAVKTFTVKNPGTEPLSLGPITVTGTGASNFTVNLAGLLNPVPANGQTTFTVTYSPTAAGVSSPTLNINNNDPSGGENNFSIALTGTGYVPQPEIAVEQPAGTNLTSGTATVSFGTAATGAAAVKTFTVKNTGDAALTLGAITFTGANAADFTVTTQPVSPVAATSGSTTFTVTFQPGAAGARSATLNLPNDDPTGSEAPFLIALTGTGSTSSQVASYGSPGSVTGGWVNGGNFTIGAVGTVNPANNWPAAESPDKATDGDANTKFLIFQGSNAGLILSPANASLAYNRLAFTTAGDAPERDPASYILYGSTTALTTTSGANIPVSSLTVIASGTLTLPDARGAGPTVVQFANTTAYASYVVVFPTVKNSPATTLTQIAEVKLSQGMNVPNAIAMGTARGGQLVGSTFTFGTVGTANPGNNWPAGQSPDNALDGDVNAKFLLFQSTGAGFIASPENGPTVVNSLSFWTADDAPERDPVSYAVYGFNTVVTQTNGTLASGTAIATGSLTLPDTRLTGPTTVSFVNNTAYASYLVVFPAVKNLPSTTITQIGEVAFANNPPTTAPLVTTPTSADILATTATLGGNVTADGGATITERGVVYALTSANADPLISGSGVTKVIAAGTIGVFTVPVTGLTASSGYSFKAYAINNVGTTYTSVATFTTAAPAVNLSVSAATGTEAGVTAITVTATAAAAVSGDQTVALAVTGTGITAGDYTLSSATITIPNGSTTGTVTFTVKDDLLNEGNETATLTISSPSAGLTLGTTLTQDITITDDDNAGTLNYGLPVAGAYRVVMNGSTVELYNSTPVLVASWPLGTDPVVINGTGGNDTLTIDLSGGNFTMPITFHGGAQTSTPGDSLALTGGTTASQTFNFTNEHDGSVSLAGNALITYTGLEPVSSAISAASVILNYSTVSEVITVSPDGTDPTLTKVDSDVGGESVSFVNPTTSLQINAGDTGNDTVNVNGFGTSGGGFSAGLTINGGTGNDTVNLNADITFAAGNSLDVNLQDDSATPGSDTINVGVNANLKVSGAGTITVKCSRSVFLNTGSSLEAVDGNLTVEANTAGTALGNFSGISLVGAKVQTTGAGGISMIGKGGNDPTSGAHRGIMIGSGGTIATTGSGSIDLQGTGGVGAGGNNGVDVQGSGTVLSIVDGDLTITGTGGAGTGIYNEGVGVFNGAVVRSTGTGAGAGTITITGTGGGTAGATESYGTDIDGINATVTSKDGAILITGTAGLGTGSFGFLLGFGGGSPGTLSSSGTAPITVVADTMRIDISGTLNGGSSTVTLRQKTNSKEINLGGADSPTQLGLTDAELDRITTGTLVIGDANSGNITISQPISPANAAALNLVTPGTIADTYTGGTDVTVATLTTSGNLAPGASPGLFSVAGNETLAANSTFTVEIGGTTAGTGYDQLNATGSVDIGANVTLSVASFGVFTPAVGNTFMIISRTGGSGTFASLPEGATVSANFLGSGLLAKVSYVGGTGDDVVITVQETPSLVVTTTSDPGSPTDAQTSLREALAYAATLSGSQTISFSSSTANGAVDFHDGTAHTITLGGTELVIGSSVILDGPGADKLSVNGNAASRVFRVSAGTATTVAGLAITNGFYDGGFADGVGGGIHSQGATLTVSNCTLSGNSARSFGKGGGGGIFSSGGSLTVVGSTLSGNSAPPPGTGGGIYNEAAALTILNSTLSDNSSGSGGALYNEARNGATSTVEVINSTLSGNSGSPGGTILNRAIAGGTATVAIGNSILKTGAVGATLANSGGAITSLGHNLSTDNGGGFLTGLGDLINTDPLLGPLQDNGGPTFTHALLPGSPAINAGDNAPALTAGLTTDQRGAGFPRLVNGTVDIGAFESPAPPAIVVEQPAGTSLASGDTNSFGEVLAGKRLDRVFTLLNNGGANLDLTGTPMVAVAGTDFSVFTQPASPVAPSNTTTFTVRFAPTSTGVKTAILTITNNDSSQSVFTLVLTGTGKPSVTAATVVGLAGYWNRDRVVVTWTCLSEQLTLGYNVYVSEANGPRTLVTPDLVYALGEWSGSTYAVEHTGVQPPARLSYWLEEVQITGSEWFGPVDVAVRAAATPVVSRMTGEGFEVEFTGQAGLTYDVEATDSLATGVWERVAVATADAAGRFTVRDPVGGAARFYRALTP